MQESPEIDSMLELAEKANDSSLLVVLGQSFMHSELGIRPLSIKELREIGVQKVDEARKKIADQLCAEHFLKTIEQLDATDKKKAILAIADMLLGYYSLPPAIYASVLILRSNIRNWCASR